MTDEQKDDNLEETCVFPLLKDKSTDPTYKEMIRLHTRIEDDRIALSTLKD